MLVVFKENPWTVLRNQKCFSWYPSRYHASTIIIIFTILKSQIHLFWHSPRYLCLYYISYSQALYYFLSYQLTKQKHHPKYKSRYHASTICSSRSNWSQNVSLVPLRLCPLFCGNVARDKNLLLGKTKGLKKYRYRHQKNCSPVLNSCNYVEYTRWRTVNIIQLSIIYSLEWSISKHMRELIE